jgi:NAD(P)-dependent dehydrogenase (short-subunit alcohol dehydrogenase family)
MLAPMSLSGQVFVVTGGAGAIARPIVAAFAKAGAKVVAVDRTLEHARGAAEPHGGLGVVADLTRPEGAEEMARTVETQLGRIDGLVHTVGGFGMGKVTEVGAADYDRMFDLNVRSLFYTVRAVLPGMQARKRGFIAGFSSEPAWTGQAPGASLYGASKAAVATFLRSLDGELAGTDVKISIVYPMGAVDTPANRRDMPDFDPARYIDPAEIADTLVFAASRGARARLPELPIFPAR